jgi:hypothetical protein
MTFLAFLIASATACLFIYLGVENGYLIGLFAYGAVFFTFHGWFWLSDWRDGIRGTFGRAGSEEAPD